MLRMRTGSTSSAPGPGLGPTAEGPGPGLTAMVFVDEHGRSAVAAPGSGLGAVLG